MTIPSTHKRATLGMRFLLVALAIYIATPFGATFNGALSPDFQQLNLALLSLLGICWVWARWRGRWSWYKTPLDLLWLLWGVVFVVSIAANPEVWRRSAIALWYMGLYACFWFVGHDIFANRKASVRDWASVLLIAGGVIMGFGYLQVANLAGQGASLLSIRPVSLLGNPNALGAYLLVIVSLASARVFTVTISPLFRLGWIAYAVLACSLLLLTFSRGAWLGLLVCGVTLGALLARDARDGRIWSPKIQSRAVKALMIIGLFALIVVIALLVFVLLQSFSTPGRSADLRLPLWRNALEQFAQRPIAGQGLFAYGRQLALAWSQPPQNSHSHAHNLVLNVAAELGLLGLLLLGASVALVARLVRRRWRERPADWATLAGGITALIGLATQHLVDMPAMMPIIAFMGWSALMLVTAEPSPQPAPAPKRAWALIGLWAILLITGWWSHHIYRQYIAILQYAIHSRDYAGAAVQLDTVVASDPQLAVYRMEQAFLWGMAAANEGTDAARRAISAYDAFLSLEPYHAISWANKAALHWQIGDAEGAVIAIKRAIELAPQEPRFSRNLMVYEGNYPPPAFTDDLLSRSDTVYGPNWALFQYFRQVYPRQFLPQVGYESSR